MKKVLQAILVIAAVLFSTSAFALMGADIEIKGGASDTVALSDFEKAVALAGGQVNTSARGPISAAGSFPDKKTTATAVIKMKNNKKILELRISHTSGSVYDAIFRTASNNEEGVTMALIEGMESLGYKNIPPGSQ